VGLHCIRAAPSRVYCTESETVLALSAADTSPVGLQERAEYSQPESLVGPLCRERGRGKLKGCEGTQASLSEVLQDSAVRYSAREASRGSSELVAA